ncbi:DUF2505 domain-containing protein [Amycolatopsis taiwanensis]|uniref:DUF2505 domain-containing protein n=1 Tax=Amycolatopsis taiwanensis TaxID=342230 RepID=A0A9W6QTJ9_9PSEU|nr:DUF2505 domain-containing protein [Amycolatopsis taiwanensis]GLY63776.1 hypothetical protein Atai01_03950 [Amycolatopsis taiwanensis]
MAFPIEHRAEFTQSLAEVFTALSDRDALQTRLDAIGGINARVATYSHEGDQWSFLLRQGVGADKLPSFVRALHSGDIVVEREQTWARTGEKYTGTEKATVGPIPGDITARSELFVEGDVTVLRVDGEVKIRIPLIGGRFEGFVAGEVTKLLQRETEFTAQWLAAR